MEETKVVPKHRLQFAMPGFKAFKRIVSQIQESTPPNTYMEVIAKGEWPFERTNELTKLVERGEGVYVPQTELPFKLTTIGMNYKGSSVSVKIAALLGLKKVEALGSAVSLGPSFIKRVN